MIKRSMTNKSGILGLRVAIIIFAFTILSLTATAGTVYANLSGWDGKWFTLAVQKVSVCYDYERSKFVEDNEVHKSLFMKFWWDTTVSRPGVDIYEFYDEQGIWECTPTQFGNVGGNDWEFLFHIFIDKRPEFFISSTQKMHSKLIDGDLKSAFFLPLGANFFSRDGEPPYLEYNCAGQMSLSGTLLNYVPVPPDGIMQNGCK